jgi:hypothetical protein
LPGFSGRFCSYRKPNFPAVSGSYLPGFSGRICNYWQPNFPAVSDSYLPVFSGRICSYWKPNFPAASVVSGRDFPAIAFLAWVIKKNCMGSRQIVLVSTAGFSVLNTGIFWREAKTKRLFSQCRGPPEFSSALSFIGGVHIGARALHVLRLIWFGKIARLSQWGWRGVNFLAQMIFTCRHYV